MRKGNPLVLLVGMQTGAALWKIVWRFLKELKIELPYTPAIALLGIYPRDTGVLFQRDTCSTIDNSQSMERAQMSING